jgi:hypothetical protein
VGGHVVGAGVALAAGAAERINAQRLRIDRNPVRHPRPSPLFKWMFEQSRQAPVIVKYSFDN